jgi:hypothetical protein
MSDFPCQKGCSIMISKPPAESRPTSGKAVPSRTQSERSGVLSSLVAGAALVGMTGALLATATPAENYAASSAPSSAAIRTVAYSTPLDSARPPARGSRLIITKEDGSSGQSGPSAQGDQPGCVSLGGQSEVCGPLVAAPGAKSSSGTGSTPTEASTGSASGSSGGDPLDQFLTFLTKIVTPVAQAVTSVGGAVKSVADDIPSLNSAGSAIGSGIGAFLHGIGH